MSLTWEPVEKSSGITDESLWIIYALGGGTGHWTRAISLARQAARHGIATRILTNSPSQFLRVQDPTKYRKNVTNLIQLDPKIEIVLIPATSDKEQISLICQRELTGCRTNDVLFVDSFPCGIAGELRETLREISAYKVFIHRDINPQYIRWGMLEDFVSQYDLVISPGDDGPLEHLIHARTNPWLVCDAHELVPRSIARDLFGVDENSRLPLIVVSGSGTPDESLEMARFAKDLQSEFGASCNIRMTSLDAQAVQEAGELSVSMWPLLTVLAGVDLLVGAGGYNTVYETRMTQTPLIAIAQNRLYDRQSRRLLAKELAANYDDLKSKIGKFLLQFADSKTGVPQTFSNGASEAFEIIAASHVRCPTKSGKTVPFNYSAEMG